MSRCFIDHIAVTSPSLEAGAQFIRQRLGVEPQPGGEHTQMGTHNLLLRLGDSLYLEVISPNPEAPAPGRPRWFGLDNLRPESFPALSTWVVRTTDIRKTAAACSESLGAIEPMSRGALDWLITIPADGRIPLDGIAPALIEWHTDVHPASKLKDAGLGLLKLELFHPEPERINRLISSIELSGPVFVSAIPARAAPHLIAHIKTPKGIIELSAQNADHCR